MQDERNKEMITSKEILVRTGISRATLNNYIKSGILPRPEVKKAGSDQEGTKKIGYFPMQVLERIEAVKQMKRQGLSMEEIARKIPEQSMLIETIVDQYPEIKESSLPLSAPIAEKSLRRRSDSALKLTIAEIKTPAYLINFNSEIEWINPEAESQIFNNKVSAIPDIESRKIFKLFFNWEFQEHFLNWEEIVAAHISVLKPSLSRSSLNSIFNGISKKETDFLENIYDRVGPAPSEGFSSNPISIISQDDTRSVFQIYSMSFREGVFCVYIPIDGLRHDLMTMLANRGRIIDELLKHRMPSLLSLCVLVADLQDSVKICAELPPAEYFELINGLWKSVGSSFARYNGIYGKHAGDGMLYYFIKRPGSNYIMDSINCALELRDRMKEFSCKWKERKGWSNELYLNTGINEGQEFFGAIHSATNVEFTALGDSINYASRLSDFAGMGSIWTTKNVISKISQEERAMIRFGVYRRQNDGLIFIENSFARPVDLIGKENQDYSHFADIAMLPITEIVSRIERREP